MLGVPAVFLFGGYHPADGIDPVPGAAPRSIAGAPLLFAAFLVRYELLHI